MRCLPTRIYETSLNPFSTVVLLDSSIHDLFKDAVSTEQACNIEWEGISEEQIRNNLKGSGRVLFKSTIFGKG
jgi:hypothetical protein